MKVFVEVRGSGEKNVECRGYIVEGRGKIVEGSFLFYNFFDLWSQDFPIFFGRVKNIPCEFCTI